MATLTAVFRSSPRKCAKSSSFSSTLAAKRTDKRTRSSRAGSRLRRAVGRLARAGGLGALTTIVGSAGTRLDGAGSMTAGRGRGSASGGTRANGEADRVSTGDARSRPGGISGALSVRSRDIGIADDLDECAGARVAVGRSSSSSRTRQAELASGDPRGRSERATDEGAGRVSRRWGWPTSLGVVGSARPIRTSRSSTSGAGPSGARAPWKARGV